MTLKVAKRGQIPPFIAMDFMRAAARREASGAHVFHLEVGQPSTGLPDEVLDDMTTLLRERAMGYTVAQGIDPLRHAIAQMYRDVYDVGVEPDQILLTTGSSGGFVLSFLAAFEPGDRVGVTVPGYPAYRHILTALGCEVVPIPVGPEANYRLTADILKAIEPPLEGVIIASPANPTGVIIPANELRALVKLCDVRGIRLISDELYHGITYGTSSVTVAGMSGNPIVVNSFSKYFCMTGWRLGWLVVPLDLLRPMECLAQNMFISPPTLSQYAGLAALRHRSFFDQNLTRYKASREILVNGLPKAGLTRFAPADGAFYVYADVSDITRESRRFCERMLAETGVAATPGLDFDDINGNKFVRFSFCAATEDVQEAVTRLTDWLG